MRELRRKLAATYPSTTFAFLPADMVSQILNFGLPAPIDVQIVGYKCGRPTAHSPTAAAEDARVPGAVDLHVQQAGDYPQFNVNVDRTKAQLVGLTQQTWRTIF